MDEITVQSILQRLTKIETLLEVDVANLKDKVDTDIKNMDARVSKIENNNTWIWRTILGAITITFK